MNSAVKRLQVAQCGPMVYLHLIYTIINDVI